MAKFSPGRMRASIRKNSNARVKIIENKAASLARIFSNAENEILKRLTTAVGGPKITSVRAEGIMMDISRIVREELTIPGTRWVQNEAPDLYNLGITMASRSQAILSGVTSFDAVASEKVRQTFLTFQNGPEFASILDEGFKRWISDVMITDAAMIAGIRDVLTEGAILGLPNADIVNRLIEDGRLKSIVTSDGRRISAEDRARAIVRTEGIRAVVQAEVAANRTAGMNAFIDVGVRDETTSGECLVSQRQIPHTLSWWQDSPMGVPPRHVLNCRDEFLAIDPASFTDADARAFGIVGYNQDSFVLDDGKLTSGERSRLEKEIKEADAKQARFKTGLRNKGFKVGTR